MRIRGGFQQRVAVAVFLVVVLWATWHRWQGDSGTGAIAMRGDFDSLATLSVAELHANADFSSDEGCRRIEERRRRMPKQDANIAGAFGRNLSALREPFKFPMEPERVVRRLASPICHQSSSAVTTTGPVLVHFVKTALANRARRDAIRETWASVLGQRTEEGGVARQEVVFVVGRATTDEVHAQLVEESRIYGDVLQFDHEDTASNLPLKVLAAMQWASLSLEPHWLYTSCDDDVIVNPFNLFKLARLMTSSSMAPSAGEMEHRGRPCYEHLPVICAYSYQESDLPARDPASKWYVSKGRYSPDRWPPHCRGGLYLMPVAMTARLYGVSRRTAYLHLDDVWITGLMRRRLGEGDTNIYAAPFSQRSDAELQLSDEGIPLSEMLLRHLWGNIDGKPVHVTDELRREWSALRARPPRITDACYTT